MSLPRHLASGFDQMCAVYSRAYPGTPALCTPTTRQGVQGRRPVSPQIQLPDYGSFPLVAFGSLEGPRKVKSGVCTKERVVPGLLYSLRVRAHSVSPPQGKRGEPLPPMTLAVCSPLWCVGSDFLCSRPDRTVEGPDVVTARRSLPLPPSSPYLA